MQAQDRALLTSIAAALHSSLQQSPHAFDAHSLANILCRLAVPTEETKGGAKSVMHKARESHLPVSLLWPGGFAAATFQPGHVLHMVSQHAVARC